MPRIAFCLDTGQPLPAEISTDAALAMLAALRRIAAMAVPGNLPPDQLCAALYRIGAEARAAIAEIERGGIALNIARLPPAAQAAFLAAMGHFATQMEG